MSQEQPAEGGQQSHPSPAGRQPLEEEMRGKNDALRRFVLAFQPQIVARLAKAVPEVEAVRCLTPDQGPRITRLVVVVGEHYPHGAAAAAEINGAYYSVSRALADIPTKYDERFGTTLSAMSPEFLFVRRRAGARYERLYWPSYIVPPSGEYEQ